MVASRKLLVFGLQPRRATSFLLLAFGVCWFVTCLSAQNSAQTDKYPALPSETPAKIEPVTDRFDYTKRDVMIPMRDGVKLNATVFKPKNQTAPLPVIFTFTPYISDTYEDRAVYFAKNGYVGAAPVPLPAYVNRVRAQSIGSMQVTFEEIRKALAATNMPPEQLIMPWSGVKFDEKGQNTGVRAILQQVQKGKYVTIYPFELAAADVVYPLTPWKDRK